MIWKRQEKPPPSSQTVTIMNGLKVFTFNEIMLRLSDLEGLYNKTLYIEGGRVKDTPSYQLRTALRELANVHTGDFRFTGTAFSVLTVLIYFRKSKFDALRCYGRKEARDRGLTSEI